MQYLSFLVGCGMLVLISPVSAVAEQPFGAPYPQSIGGTLLKCQPMGKKGKKIVVEKIVGPQLSSSYKDLIRIQNRRIKASPKGSAERLRLKSELKLLKKEQKAAPKICKRGPNPVLGSTLDGAYCCGSDLDNSGIVDWSDLWLGTQAVATQDAVADLNGDGQILDDDLFTIQ